MLRRFDFAPIAIIEPKDFDLYPSGTKIFKDLLTEIFGDVEGVNIYAAAVKRANDFSVVVKRAGDNDIYETYANGLSYPLFAPLTAANFEYGNALPWDTRHVGFTTEWGKIKRIVRAVCERLAGTYSRALTAFESELQFDVNGRTQTSGTTDAQTFTDDYYRGGTAGVSGTPTGRVGVETSTGSEGITSALGGFSDIWQGLNRFGEGELVHPATIVVDAIFEALFVEYNPVGDVLVFGDQKTKLWG